MDADFPAAHSMDTQWFAADRDGNVAIFISGESGAVPVFSPRLPAALSRRLHAAGECLACDYFYPGPGSWGHRGFFVYNHLCEYWGSGPYGRTEFPTRPVHLDQLPPRLRAEVGRRH